MGIPWFIAKFAGYLYLCFIVEKLKPGKITINYRKTILSPMMVTSLIRKLFYILFRPALSSSFKVIISCSLIFLTSIPVNLILYDRSLQGFSYIKKRIKT